MSDAFELEICQGKYRYRYEAGKQEVWRNGYIWQTLNGKLIGDKFVFSLAVELDEALKERDALRAKVEAMEQQRPFAWIVRGGYPVPLENLEWQLLCGAERPTLSWTNQEMRPLYALPGAKGEEK